MKRKIILIIICILILTLSILGITYAFMKPQVEDEYGKSNITINACAKVQLKDNGNTINLKNSYPMDDDMGLETEPYEFTINSTCDNCVGFNLYLTSLNDNEIEDNNIHFAITSEEDIVLVNEILSKTTNALTEFNNEELKELDIGIKGKHKNIYKVYSNSIPLKGESNYKLYLWVDKDANNETMGKSFKVGLSVKSYNREMTYADVCDPSLGACQIAQKAYENNILFYHDANLKNSANDLSYRYSGASDKVNNFICLDNKNTGTCETDDNLYRIIGLFKNEDDNYEMKLIKAQGATATELGDGNVEGGAYYGKYTWAYEYYKGTNFNNLVSYRWNSTSETEESNVNMWKESNLNKVNLNDFYYNYMIKMAPYLKNYILKHNWVVGGFNLGNYSFKKIYDYELGVNRLKSTDKKCYTQGSQSVVRECNLENDLIYQDYIGLLYISDYIYATTPKFYSSSVNDCDITSSSYNGMLDSNWMYLGAFELSISRDSSRESYIRRITSGGGPGYISKVTDGNFIVRPSFYITTDVQFTSGDGSKGSPYRLSV